MIDIILISPKEIEAGTLENILSTAFTVYKHSHSEGIVVLGAQSSLFAEPSALIIEPEPVEAHYTTLEIERIRANISDPLYYIVRFKRDKENLLEKVLTILSNLSKSLMIDDDHGHLVSLTDFLVVLQSNPNKKWLEIVSELESLNLKLTDVGK